MQRRMSARRCPTIIMLLVTLLMISATAEAGITVVPKNTQLSGDPRIDWSFSVYLTPGSTLTASTLSSIDSVTFTVENVIGLNWQNEIPDIQISNVSLTNGLPDGAWLWDPQTFSYGTQQLEGTTVATTTAPFDVRCRTQFHYSVPPQVPRLGYCSASSTSSASIQVPRRCLPRFSSLIRVP